MFSGSSDKSTVERQTDNSANRQKSKGSLQNKISDYDCYST